MTGLFPLAQNSFTTAQGAKAMAEGDGNDSWQWFICVQHEDWLRFLVTPDIFAFRSRDGADEDNISLHTWMQTCCPHKSVSLYIPIINYGKKVRLLHTKRVSRQTQPDDAELVESIWEDTITGAEVCDCKTGRVEDAGAIGLWVSVLVLEEWDDVKPSLASFQKFLLQ